MQVRVSQSKSTYFQTKESMKNQLSKREKPKGIKKVAKKITTILIGEQCPETVRSTIRGSCETLLPPPTPASMRGVSIPRNSSIPPDLIAVDAPSAQTEIAKATINYPIFRDIEPILYDIFSRLRHYEVDLLDAMKLDVSTELWSDSFKNNIQAIIGCIEKINEKTANDYSGELNLLNEKLKNLNIWANNELKRINRLSNMEEETAEDQTIYSPENPILTVAIQRKIFGKIWTDLIATLEISSAR